MNEMSYKGYTIDADPQLTESKQWLACYAIYEHRGSRTEDEPIISSETFETKDEAIQHCFQLAKKRIDDRIAGKLEPMSGTER
jgi:hypothetical protein